MRVVDKEPIRVPSNEKVAQRVSIEFWVHGSSRKKDGCKGSILQQMQLTGHFSLRVHVNEAVASKGSTSTWCWLG